MIGDCQRSFADAAREDGFTLIPQAVPWLCERGHLALPESASHTRSILNTIYLRLGGDVAILASGRLCPLRGDFIDEGTGTLLEVDESQHFTSARLATLELYPTDAQLGFDLDVYKSLCQNWRAKSDRYYAKKAARGFGTAGRQRQRAYYDALRDLATPTMGRPPLIRIPAPDRDGRAAYAQHRAMLTRTLGSVPPRNDSIA